MGQRKGERAFTLVELMLVIAILGILASLAVPGFRRYVKNAYTTEAVGVVGRLWMGAVAYYETDHVSATGALLPKQFPLGSAQEGNAPRCCTRPGGMCPGNDPLYVTNPILRSLNYSMADPHRYRAEYTGTGGKTPRFTAVACADLDCDGTYGMYTRRGSIDAVTGDVRGDPKPWVLNEAE